MKAFQIIYNSFVWGLMVAILAFQNVWLEMRMNIGLLIPIVTIISIGLLTLTKKGRLLSFRFSAINVIACMIVSVLTLGLKRMMIVPASIVREGIGITQVSFFSVNMILAALLIGGLVVVYFGSKKINESA